jgi:hypothetical protein
VVEHLRERREGADRRQTAADHTEVEGGDAEPGGDSGHDRATVGEGTAEHDSPAQRDGDVRHATGEEEDRTVLHVREHSAADGPGGREHVLSSADGDRYRRRSAQRRAGGAGRQAVGQAPVRWTASVRRRA